VQCLIVSSQRSFALLAATFIHVAPLCRSLVPATLLAVLHQLHAFFRRHLLELTVAI
jgi:hypothetical protein